MAIVQSSFSILINVTENNEYYEINNVKTIKHWSYAKNVSNHFNNGNNERANSNRSQMVSISILETCCYRWFNVIFIPERVISMLTTFRQGKMCILPNNLLPREIPFCNSSSNYNVLATDQELSGPNECHQIIPSCYFHRTIFDK